MSLVVRRLVSMDASSAKDDPTTPFPTIFSSCLGFFGLDHASLSALWRLPAFSLAFFPSSSLNVLYFPHFLSLFNAILIFSPSRLDAPNARYLGHPPKDAIFESIACLVRQ